MTYLLPSCVFSKDGLRQLLIQPKGHPAKFCTFPSTLMKEGPWGRLEAHTSYTVPSSASSAGLQPASAIEASI